MFFFLKNYPSKSEFLGLIEKTTCVNLFCISGDAYILYTKSFGSRKCQFFLIPRFKFCVLFLKTGKIFQVFFIKLDQIDFVCSQSTIKALFAPNFWKKKQVKSAVYGHVLENFDQKIAFCGAFSPSKLVYFGTVVFFTFISGSVDRKWMS